MTQLIVQDGQNLPDIALQCYGAAEMVLQILEDNPWLQTIDSAIRSGDVLLINPDKVVNQSVVDFYKKIGHTVNTGEDAIAFAAFSDGYSYGYDI